MTHLWIWEITCPIEKHKFHSEHYRRGIVVSACKRHRKMDGCAEIDEDMIKRIAAPDDDLHRP